MRELSDEIVRRCGAGETLAFCVVVGAKGSTPQQRGAKMLVLGDGKTVGTLGGGCVEAEVRKRAMELMQAGQSKLLNFRLDHDYGWDDGLVCGGIMDIAVQLLRSERDAEPFERINNALNSNRTEALSFDYRDEESAKTETYRETIEPPAQLIIAGGGHVAQALAAIAAPLGFAMTVIDDRADFVSPERFPDVRHRITGEIDFELGRQAIDERSFIVIVTRGHRHDGTALGAVVRSSARYIGLIGSKRKIRRILEDLSDQGVAREQLARVHAPIGLDIGSVTVPEIAISIAAELVAVRRGLAGQSARPMKMTNQELATWLDRESLEVK